MIVVICRAKAQDRSWLIFGEDNSAPPSLWQAPPQDDQIFDERLEGALAGCFEAQWLERQGAKILSLGARLPLPADPGHQTRRPSAEAHWQAPVQAESNRREPVRELLES